MNRQKSECILQTMVFEYMNNRIEQDPNEMTSDSSRKDYWKGKYKNQFRTNSTTRMFNINSTSFDLSQKRLFSMVFHVVLVILNTFTYSSHLDNSIFKMINCIMDRIMKKVGFDTHNHYRNDCIRLQYELEFFMAVLPQNVYSIDVK